MAIRSPVQTALRLSLLQISKCLSCAHTYASGFMFLPLFRDFIAPRLTDGFNSAKRRRLVQVANDTPHGQRSTSDGVPGHDVPAARMCLPVPSWPLVTESHVGL